MQESETDGPADLTDLSALDGHDGGDHELPVSELPVSERPVHTERPDRHPTGDAAVDASLDRLAEVDGLPLQQQIDAAEAVHQGLQRRLSDLSD